MTDFASDFYPDSPADPVADRLAFFRDGRIGRHDYVRLDLEDAAPGHIFHDECGWRWDIHANDDPRSIGPFGCPPDEATARQRWGR